MFCIATYSVFTLMLSEIMPGVTCKRGRITFIVFNLLSSEIFLHWKGKWVMVWDILLLKMLCLTLIFFSITANTGLWIVSAILISTKKYSKSYSFIIKVVSKTFSITIMALTGPPVMKLISLLDKCCYTQET